jgi:hypothetical protein
MDSLLPVDGTEHEVSRDCAGLIAGPAVARIQREVIDYGPFPPADDMALLVFRGM